MLNIQDYFEYIINTHEKLTDNPSLRINVNKTENRITFKIKSTNSKIDKDINGGKVSRFQVAEVVLVHCNVVNSDYQRKSRVLNTFVPNKSCGQLLDILLKSFFIY